MVSQNLNRLAFSSPEGFQVWDADADRVVFRDSSVKGPSETLGISSDGQRVAWSTTATAHLRDLSTGLQRELALDREPDRLEFSPDATQLVAVTPGSLSLWDVATGRALWSVSNLPAGQLADVRWSADRRSLLLAYSWSGTLLFDAASGERLARFPGEHGLTTVVRHDLHAELVVSRTSWDLIPLPQPASDSPSECLARTLKKTGLALEGVEIVAAPRPEDPQRHRPNVRAHRLHRTPGRFYGAVLERPTTGPR